MNVKWKIWNSFQWAYFGIPISFNLRLSPKQNHAAYTTQNENRNLTFGTEPALIYQARIVGFFNASKICYQTKMPSHVMRFIYLLFRFNCANPFIMVVLGTIFVFTHAYCLLYLHPINFERTNNKLGIANRMVFCQLIVQCTVNVLHCSIWENLISINILKYGHFWKSEILQNENSVKSIVNKYIFPPYWIVNQSFDLKHYYTKQTNKHSWPMKQKPIIHIMNSVNIITKIKF